VTIHHARLEQRLTRDIIIAEFVALLSLVQTQENYRAARRAAILRLSYPAVTLRSPDIGPRRRQRRERATATISRPRIAC